MTASVRKSSPEQSRSDIVPCNNCRDKHLKCDYDLEQCQRCRRSNQQCVRGRNNTKIRFRHGSHARYGLTFAKDQHWLKTRKPHRLRFIDETLDVIAGYHQECDLDTDSEVCAGQNESQLSAICESTSRTTGTSQGSQSSDTSPRDEPSQRGVFDDKQTPVALSSTLQTSSSIQSSVYNTVPVPNTAEPAYTNLPQHPTIDLSDDPFFCHLVKQPSAEICRSQSRRQAILMRYFSEEIARRFDLCNPERHFTHVVPQRARSSPPLLNAILTTSARHLTRLPRHRNADDIVEWQGYVLPDLTEESAVYYHNECIKDLLRLSMDPAQIHNENLLAAAIILRTDEEMDAPLRDDSDGDKEVFLQMLSIFLNAQVPSAAAVPHRSGAIYPREMSPMSQPRPVSVSSTPLPRTDSLRQACFWVALRQEVFTSFMKQRPPNFPLSRCEAFRNFSPAEDAVWADRLVIFCADVLQYCYGGPSDTTTPQRHADNKERWHALKQYEAELGLVLPSSFEPVYYRAPNRQAGEIFPEIWYLDDCHVTGTTHAELARILLAVYDPSRPKLGPDTLPACAS
ncbi:hypothetical protein VTN96DRAFT_2088 [Rasamsonia emersonii]